MTRRKFVGSLGASTVLPAVAASLRGETSQGESQHVGRQRVDLNGSWERHLNGVHYDTIQVPSSQRPLGFYHLKRSFLLPALSKQQRVILHFEAITYHGRVSVNGAELGTMGPYTPYEFDATPHIKPGSNTVDVGVADVSLDPGGAGRDEIELGVNPGWEGYGGIIRDVYVEIRPAAFIDNVHLTYDFAPDYAKATCRVTLFLSSTAAGQGKVGISLESDAGVAARAEKSLGVQVGNSEAELNFELSSPALWSPERPNIYRLRATLESPAGTDQFNRLTGFRELTVRGRRFYLNGARLQLHGLSWLGLWKDQGFTLSRQQIAQDMQGIKAMGANFVRLHLFPQDRYVVEMADRLGLLIWEEPGYWQVDFTTMRRSMIDLGLGILERTIRRDWNSPSVSAWILGNESTLTVDYLREGKALCNKLDPGRLVSFADSTPPEKAKGIFDRAGLDFYSQHPYTFNAHDFNRISEALGPDKPLVYDEWGGRAIAQSPILMQQQTDRLLDLMEKDELAGEVFFDWNDWPEFSRIDLEMVDGVCSAGVVSEAREFREEIYGEVSRLFQGRRHEEPPSHVRPAVVPLRFQPWSSKNRFQPIELQALAEADQGKKAWTQLESLLPKFWDQAWLTHGQWKRTGEKFLLWQGAEVEISGVVFRVPVAGGYARPLVITTEAPEVTIPVGLDCTRLHFLGQVTLPTGFPATGKAGDTVASYTVRYSGGRVQEVPLRNGFEIAVANMVDGATRINPDTSVAQRALVFVKDFAREHYQALLFSLPAHEGKVESIVWKLGDNQFPLALFAITAELTEVR